ncbi:MAG: CoA pyrophosphatase [Maribacter sp.]|nr:CoA pyrophosphatase [Maribacter sp.]
MEFNLFSQKIPKIKNLPLPGEASHFKMAPAARIQLMQENKWNKNNAKQAGVLAMFYPNLQHRTNLLLILRKTYAGIHSNQIGFPGGKYEKGDKDLSFTALRETEEEVGVPRNQVQILKSLSKVYIPPSNFEVQPFVGLYQSSGPFVLEEAEVAALVEVSLDDFMDDAKIFAQKLSTSYASEIEVPAFHLNGHTVWGATAMMLSEIKELLKQIL